MQKAENKFFKVLRDAKFALPIFKNNTYSQPLRGKAE